jgi:hypothetical protein
MNHQGTKKQACERCRELKLRCRPGSDMPYGSCERCSRVGATCYHAYDDRYRTAPSRRRSSTATPVNRPSTSLATPDSLLATGASSSANLAPNLISQVDIASSLSAYLADGVGNATTAQHSTSTISEPPEQQSRQWGELGSIDIGSGIPDFESIVSEEGFLLGNTPSDNDSMAPLHSVSGSISRQLASFRSQSYDSPNLRRVPFNCSLLEDSHGSHEASSLEDAISTTGRFIMVLQMLAPVQGVVASTSGPTPLTSLPSALVLLSTYIRLVQLLETILTQTDRILEEETERWSTPYSQKKPKTRSTMHVLTVLRVFEHQLHCIERLLGVPSGHRLWSQRDTYMGILDERDFTSIVQTTMDQEMETFRSLKRTMEHIQKMSSDTPPGE